MVKDFQGEPVFGGTYPAEIFHDFMQQALKGESSQGFPLVARRAAERLRGRHPPRPVRAGADRLQGRARADHAHRRPADEADVGLRARPHVRARPGRPEALVGPHAGRTARASTSSGSTSPRSPARRSTASSTRCRSRASRCRSATPCACSSRRTCRWCACPRCHRPQRRRGGGAPAGGQVPRRDRGRRHPGGRPPGEVIGQDIRADAPSPRRSVITLAVVGESGAMPRARPERPDAGRGQDVMRQAGLRVESERANGGSTTRDDDERRRHRRGVSGVRCRRAPRSRC